MPLDRPASLVTVEDLPDPHRFRTLHPFLSGVFSQWSRTPFDLAGRRFVTAEQWMMFRKATLFGDEPSAGAILATDNPASQKALGRRIAGYN